MGAPKGNQFWKLRAKHGRDKLFATPELLWSAACEYFEWCEANPLLEQVIQKVRVSRDAEEIRKETLDKLRPFTMQGLCIYLNCNVTYFWDFKKTCSKDFSEIVTRIEEVVFNQKFVGAASGFFNANIIARDLGLVDKREIDAQITAKQQLTIEQFNLLRLDAERRAGIEDAEIIKDDE